MREKDFPVEVVELKGVFDGLHGDYRNPLQ
jgi:hypothetical protein